MQGSSTSRGWLIHLGAGIALGAAVVLVAWIVSGGQPFGRIIGSDDVSEPTSAATEQTAVERRAVSAAQLGSSPPKLGRSRQLEFIKPKAKAAKAKAAKAKAAKAAKAKRAKAQPKRAARPTRKRRSPVVRVVAPPSGEVVDAPVAAVPDPSPTAVPAPAAPAPTGGAGGGSAKPSPPDPTYWVGEG